MTNYFKINDLEFALASKVARVGCGWDDNPSFVVCPGGTRMCPAGTFLCPDGTWFCINGTRICRNTTYPHVPPTGTIFEGVRTKEDYRMVLERELQALDADTSLPSTAQETKQLLEQVEGAAKALKQHLKNF